MVTDLIAGIDPRARCPNRRVPVRSTAPAHATVGIHDCDDCGAISGSATVRCCCQKYKQAERHESGDGCLQAFLADHGGLLSPRRTAMPHVDGGNRAVSVVLRVVQTAERASAI